MRRTNLGGGALAGMAAAFLLTGSAQAQTGGLRSETLYVEAAPAQAKAVTAKLRAYVAAAKAEPGSFSVRLLTELGRPERLAVHEVWKSQAALDAHLASPARKSLPGDLAALTLAPIDDRLGTVVTPADAAPAKGGLHVLTHVDVAPPASAAIAEAFKSQVGAAGGWPGFLTYEVSIQPDHTNHFTILESWRDRKAFNSWSAEAAAKGLRAQIAGVKGALYDERLYRNAP